MAKLPAYARELLDARRFGNRRPKFNAVFITDWWEMARDNRDVLGYCTLVVEPFERYNLGCCADLDVIVVMRGDSALVRHALRRVGPRSVHTCSDEQYVRWLESIAKSRALRKAA
jgi:hypothetical protein